MNHIWMRNKCIINMEKIYTNITTLHNHIANWLLNIITFYHSILGCNWYCHDTMGRKVEHFVGATQLNSYIPWVAMCSHGKYHSWKIFPYKKWINKINSNRAWNFQLQEAKFRKKKLFNSNNCKLWWQSWSIVTAKIIQDPKKDKVVLT